MVEASIKDLDEDMITEIQQYIAIPPVVLNVMYGLCAAFGKPPLPEEVKQLIKKQAELITRMKEFDPRTISISQHHSLDKCIYSKEFDLQIISRYCTGAVLIAEWLVVVHSENIKMLAEEMHNNAELDTEYQPKLKKCKSFNALTSKPKTPKE